MVKKIKRKAQRGQKDKRATTTNPKTVSEEQNPTPEQITEVASAVKVRKECSHLDKSMDLTKVSSKLELTEDFKCDECREGSLDRKATKKKVKQKKNKGSDSKAIWVCLECGHFGCGGVGLPTINQSHAVRHAKLTGHPLVIQVEKSQLRWCFPCSKLISMDRFENGEQKDVLFNVVKLFKQKPAVGSTVDVEDIWFGNGSVLNEVKSGRSFYAVRGLSNLGNTCFFNSVLQNLLAMDRFQNDLLKLSDSTGPLTNSLKKLYVEINAESGLRSVLNPKSLFGCVCSKAPQFRGYQQQDSHELLRYLLDGLSTEELRVKKSTNSCPKEVNPSQINTTFIDTIFGGQLSSTVCCVECGHSSTVYEPYLDLSLPVPTKKPPPRKIPTVSRNRKTKPPPKKKQTVSQNKKIRPVQVDPTTVSESSHGSLPSVNSSSLVGPTECGNVVDDNNNALPQHAVCSDDSTWMDYAEPLSLEDEQDSALKGVEFPANHGSTHQGVGNGCENSEDGFAWMEFLEPVSANQDSDRTDMLPSNGINEDLDRCHSFVNSYEDEVALQVGDSEVLLLPYTEEAIEPSSSVVADTDDMLCFDGFADMFNEPEVIMGPQPQPQPQPNPSTGAGEDIENGSESNPDEVDDTDSPVSIESCLSHFTKPELLADEHAWHCENCTKILVNQRKSRKKKLQSVPATKNGYCEEHRLRNGFSESSAISQINNQAEMAENDVSNSSEDSTEHAATAESGESDEDEAESKGVKAMRNATKRILINKFPSILTIHLKRFNQDARGRLSKLNGHVVFKEVVDLKPYMDTRCPDKEGECKYRLIGVVEHLGSMRGGHYVAYVRGGDRTEGDEFNGHKSVWYYASDAHVHEAPLEQVLRCEAYILFYEKV